MAWRDLQVGREAEVRAAGHVEPAGELAQMGEEMHSSQHCIHLIDQQQQECQPSETTEEAAFSRIVSLVSGPFQSVSHMNRFYSKSAPHLSLGAAWRKLQKNDKKQPE